MEYWIVVLAVWLFYEWRKRRSYQRKNDERFALVISNLDRIDRRIDELKELPVRVAQLEKRPAEPLPTPVPAAPTATALPPAQAPKEPPRAIPPSSVFEPVPLIPLPPLPPPDPRVEPPRPATNMPSIQPPPPRPAQPPSIPSAPPVALGARPGASAPTAARRKAFEIEEKLGQNWLNKIGIVALVIGIALFLAYKFPSLSNPGRVGLDYAVSLSLLGTGVFLERLDR